MKDNPQCMPCAWYDSCGDTWNSPACRLSQEIINIRVLDELIDLQVLNDKYQCAVAWARHKGINRDIHQLAQDVHALAHQVHKNAEDRLNDIVALVLSFNVQTQKGK